MDILKATASLLTKSMLYFMAKRWRQVLRLRSTAWWQKSKFRPPLKSHRSIRKNHHTEPLQQVFPDTNFDPTQAFVFNFPSESPIFFCYSSTYFLIPKWIGEVGVRNHCDIFPGLKAAVYPQTIIALSAFCYITSRVMCLKPRYFLLQAVKFRVTVTCPSTISSVWGFISSQWLPFASPKKPISFFLLFMVTTIVLFSILLHTILTVHIRNHFLKIHLTCLGFSWLKSCLHENDS